MRVKGGKRAVVNAIYFQHCSHFDAYILIEVDPDNCYLVDIDVGNCTTRNRYEYVLPHCTYPTKAEILYQLNQILGEL